MTASTAPSSSGIRSGGTSPVRMNASRMPSRSRSAIRRSRRMPSPIQTNRTLGLAASTSAATARMSSCPLSSNSRATVAKATSSSASPSSRRTSSREPRRIEKRVGVHAAVDGQELLGPADAGGERLLGHRVADADDRVAPPGRPALEGDVEPVLERRLERAERHAVDRVDDRRHLLVPGGRPAEDARLRAVRVHDLGLEPAERRAQLAVRPAGRRSAGSAGPARASPRPSGPAARPGRRDPPRAPRPGR